MESFKAKHVQKTIEEIDKIVEPGKASAKKRSKSGVIISGYTDFYVRMARCCSPIPGDDIIGFVSRARGVVIHRADCPNVANMEKDRIVDVEWDIATSDTYDAVLKVKTDNRSGILASVTAAIANMGLAIAGASVSTNVKEHTADMLITVSIRSLDDIETLTNKINGIKGVISVSR